LLRWLEVSNPLLRIAFLQFIMFFQQAFFSTFLTLNPLRPACLMHLALNFSNERTSNDNISALQLCYCVLGL
jgi:hypothetical protein